ncbi:hypothetical protein OSB04_019407 [Centaurea solstitialis]|uniref:DUF8040 domain-containing protein n=1 Tax=Centaurea solstitialis TaxID=347529 RepID=A0AA38SRX8_9ASTR|nr:hypothetical protein OSB04_019407 [Centaurea solstitialis]
MDEWRENKLKEKPEAKKSQFKGLSPLLEERWDHLFGDAVATGESCVAPSLTPEFVDQLVSQVEEIENREGGIQDKDGTSDAYNGCSQYSKRLEGLDYQEASFWEGFIEDVRARNKGVWGSAFLRQHLKKADERHSEIMDLFKQGTNSKKDEVSIDHIMEIMNRMATMSAFEIGGATWCHAMLMFRNPTTREIFFKMPSDDARLSWLEFLEMDDNQRNQLLLHFDLANLEEDVELNRYYYTRIHKEPCMTSTQTGHAWMEEILNGHPIRCVNAFRMSASLFMQLCKELQQKYGLMPSRKISMQEKVGVDPAPL